MGWWLLIFCAACLALVTAAASIPLSIEQKHDGLTFQSYSAPKAQQEGLWAVSIQTDPVDLGVISPGGAAVPLRGFVNSSLITIDDGFLRIDGDMTFQGVEIGNSTFHKYSSSFWLATNASLSQSSSWAVGGGTATAGSSGFALPMETGISSTTTFNTAVSMMVQVKFSWPAAAVIPYIGCGSVAIWAGHRWISRSSWLSCTGVWTQGHAQARNATWPSHGTVAWDRWAASHSFVLHLQPSPGLLSQQAALAPAANESHRMQQEVVLHPWGFTLVPSSGIASGCSAGGLSTVRGAGALPSPTLHQLSAFAARTRPPHAIVQLIAHGDGFCVLYVAGELSCWGDNTAGQLGLGNTQAVGLLDTPAETPMVSVGEPVIHVSSKSSTVCVVTVSRAVKCWGSNSHGQLGRGNTDSIGAADLPSAYAGIDVGTPSTPGAQVRSVEVGTFHACALWDDGAVKCWGSNSNGQLGLGVPTPALGDDSGELPSTWGFVDLGPGVKAHTLFAGSFHACAWTSQPRFNCWGSQARFMHFRNTGNHRDDNVGDNETPYSYAETSDWGYGQTSNLEVVSLSSSGEQTWMILSDGSVRALGWNGGGELGVGNAVNYDWNILSFPHVKDVVRVGGAGPACFTLVAGDVMCFGGGHVGGVGFSNLRQSSLVGVLPTIAFEVPAIDSSASSAVACALLATQEVRCWGAAEATGRGLGRASTTSTNLARWQEKTPMPQPSTCADKVTLDTVFLRVQEPVVPTYIAAGFIHTCAIGSNEKVYCFGSNGAGMTGTGLPEAAGDNEVIGDSGPVPLPRGWHVRRVSIGDAGICIISTGGTMMCWGTNTAEGLGMAHATVGATETVGETATPHITVRGTGEYYVEVAMGSRYAVSITWDGDVVGWGRNDNAQAAVPGNPATPQLATRDLTVLGTVVSIAAAYWRTCAVDSAGAMACTHSGSMPLSGCDGALCGAASLGGGGAVQVSGQSYTFCYLRADGSVRCFGGASSVYGDGAGSSVRYTHIGEATVSLSEAAIQVAVASGHACAVLVSGRVQCWGTGGARLGYGHSDTIGDNELVSSQTPLLWSSPATQVAVGAEHSCVLLQAGEMRCWGSGSRLGVGSASLVVGSSSRADASAEAVRFTRQPLVLDACGEIQGIHPSTKVYGPTAALDSVSSVDLCPSCHGSLLTSVPTWLLHVAHLAPQKGMLDTPASTNAACTRGGIDVSNAFDLTSQSPQFGVSAEPWVESCAWPDGWARTEFIFVSTVTFSTRDVPVAATVPAVLSSLGGQSVALKGSLWALVLLDFSQGGFSIHFGQGECVQPQLLYGDTVTCLSPSLSYRDATQGVPVTIEHSVQFVQSPLLTGVNVSYAAPIIAAVQPGTGLNVTGGSTVIVRGQHLSDNEVLGQGRFLDLQDVQVAVYNSSNVQSQAAAVGRCEVFNISSSEVHCRMPPGAGTVFLRLVTAGQQSDAISVQYAAPVVHSVLPSFVMWSPNASHTADFTLIGSSFNPAFPVAVQMAGVQCGRTVFVASDRLRCIGLRTSLLQLSPVQAAVAVQNGPSSSSTAGLLRVYGVPQVTGLNPAVLPNAGGALTVTGVEFGPDVSEQADLPASGTLIAVRLETAFSAQPVECSGLVYTGGSVSCTVPPGIGPVVSLTVFRQGGASAVRRGGLRFELPTVTAVAPDFIQQTPPGMNGFLDLNITGSGFGVAAVSATSLGVTVAGATCATVHYVQPGALQCRGLDTARIDPLLDAGDIVQVQVNNESAVVSRTAAVQLYGKPILSAVRPPVLTAGGGSEVDIVGADFGPGRLQDIVSVSFGRALCQPVLAVSNARIRCVAPSAAAGAPDGDEDAAADVNVRFASGFNIALVLGISWARPEILQVVGGELLNAVHDSPLRSTLFVQGLALSARGDVNSTQLIIDGLPCRSMGGQVSLSADFRRVTCSGFRVAALRGAAPGSQRLAFATVVTDEGVQANSSLATVRVMGPPLLRLTDPSVVRQGEMVRLIGDGFGWADSDLVSATIGTITVPASAITRTSDTSADVIVPAPLSPQLQDVTNLGVTLTLRTGYTSTLPISENIGYDIPPAPPLTPPVLPCVYRVAGVVRVQFAWTPDAVTRVTPVAGWVVEFTTSPWFVGAFSSASSLLQTRVVSVDGATGDDLNRHNQPTAQCSAEFAIANQAARRLQVDTATVFYDVKVLDVPAQPVWVRVRANTLPSSRALDGPPSSMAGPLFDQCSLGEYLATQYAARGEWDKAVCMPCPAGAVCNGLPAEAVTNAPGFARVPWGQDGLQFQACRTASMCPRGPTPLLATSTLAYLLPPAGLANNSTSRVPLALQPVSAQASNVSLAGSTLGQLSGDVSLDDACARGHTGLLCAQCAAGWSMADTGLCQQCPADAVVWGSLFGWTAVGGVWIVALVVTNLRARGRPGKPHVAMATLLMNHAQQIALASSFPLQWPPLMETMFGLFSTTTDVGAQRISIDCVVPSSQAFLYGVGLQMAMPVFMLLAFALFWGAVAAYRDLACCMGCRNQCSRPCSAGALRPRHNTKAAPAASVQVPELDDSVAASFTASRDLSLGSQDDNPLTVTATPMHGSGSPLRQTQSALGGDSKEGAAATGLAQPPPISPQAAAVAWVDVKKTSPQAHPSPTGKYALTTRTLTALRSRQAEARLTPSASLVVSAVVALFVLHLGLTKAGLSLVTCTTVLGRRLLVADLNVDCDDPGNQVWMYASSVPALLVYGLGIPLGAQALVIAKRKQLWAPHVREVYGFLYVPYHPEQYYWHGVAQLRKVLLAVVSVWLAPAGLGFQVSVGVLVLVTSLVAHASVQPYRSPLLNKLETGSVALAALTLSTATTLLDSNTAESMKELATVFIVSANGAFLVLVACFIVHSAGRSLKSARLRTVVAKSADDTQEVNSVHTTARAAAVCDAPSGVRADPSLESEEVQSAQGTLAEGVKEAWDVDKDFCDSGSLELSSTAPTAFLQVQKDSSA